MKLLESLRLSWRSIRGHRLRSALTALGVIVGIAAVIAFVTLGASLQAGIIGDISPDDQRNLYGWAAEPETEGGPLAGAQFVFSQDDLDAVSELEDVEAAYGYVTIDAQSVSYRGETSLQGEGLIASGPSYIREDDLREGRQFEMGEREAVINPAAAGQFEENVSVGDELEVTTVVGETTTVTVVGITDASEGLSPFEGFEEAPRIYVPTDPFYVEQAIGPAADGVGSADDENGDDGEDVRFLAIVVEAPSADEDAIDAARESAIAYLESEDSDAGEFLGASGGDGNGDGDGDATDDDDGDADDTGDLQVTLQTSAELLQQLEDILGLLQNFIVGIAALSLFVASIGIANIMLVSVTERTREIGIMKAVGAQNRDVLGLFLSEAIILGLIGAVLGTALGLAIGYLGAWYIDLPLVYPLEYVVLAIAVGVIVGIVSGLYPAWRAARTDPIDALRYE